MPKKEKSEPTLIKVSDTEESERAPVYAAGAKWEKIEYDVARQELVVSYELEMQEKQEVVGSRITRDVYTLDGIKTLHKFLKEQRSQFEVQTKQLKEKVGDLTEETELPEDLKVLAENLAKLKHRQDSHGNVQAYQNSKDALQRLNRQILALESRVPVLNRNND